MHQSRWLTWDLCTVVQTYFVELTTHHCMLASLRDLADLSTRQRCEEQHSELDEATRVLQDDAELQLRRLQWITHQWDEFSRVFDSEREWLSKLASRQQQAAAVVISDIATLQELQQLSGEYQDIQQAVTSRMSSVTQVCICLGGCWSVVCRQKLKTHICCALTNRRFSQIWSVVRVINFYRSYLKFAKVPNCYCWVVICLPKSWMYLMKLWTLSAGLCRPVLHYCLLSVHFIEWLEALTYIAFYQPVTS